MSGASKGARPDFVLSIKLRKNPENGSNQQPAPPRRLGLEGRERQHLDHAGPRRGARPPPLARGPHHPVRQRQGPVTAMTKLPDYIDPTIIPNVLTPIHGDVYIRDDGMEQTYLGARLPTGDRWETPAEFWARIERETDAINARERSEHYRNPFDKLERLPSRVVVFDTDDKGVRAYVDGLGWYKCLDFEAWPLWIASIPGLRPVGRVKPIDTEAMPNTDRRELAITRRVLEEALAPFGHTPNPLDSVHSLAVALAQRLSDANRPRTSARAN